MTTVSVGYRYLKVESDVSCKFAKIGELLVLGCCVDSGNEVN